VGDKLCDQWFSNSAIGASNKYLRHRTSINTWISQVLCVLYDEMDANPVTGRRVWR